MLDAVQDYPFLITEDDIAVLTHDLHNQSLVTEIPHLVQVFYVDVEDAL